MKKHVVVSRLSLVPLSLLKKNSVLIHVKICVRTILKNDCVCVCVCSEENKLIFYTFKFSLSYHSYEYIKYIKLC